MNRSNRYYCIYCNKHSRGIAVIYKKKDFWENLRIVCVFVKASFGGTSIYPCFTIKTYRVEGVIRESIYYNKYVFQILFEIIVEEQRTITTRNPDSSTDARYAQISVVKDQMSCVWLRQGWGLSEGITKYFIEIKNVVQNILLLFKLSAIYEERARLAF